MNRTLLHLAVAAALAAAGSASASTTAAFTYTAANTAVVNISGSSATNTQLKLFAQNVLCDSTNQVTLSNDSNNFAVVCTPKPGKITLSAGKTNIAIVKNSVGGSGQGITPEIAQSTLPFLNVFGAAGSTTPAIPNFGVSDEEPAVLVAAGAASGDITKLTSIPLNVVTFGTPVTLGLRNALQQAQIASGALPGSCTVGDESEACMPSLSKAQIASIFSGNAVDWSEFGLTNPSGDNAIYVARRVVTSGTQTGSRVFFLNDPCAKNVAPFVNGNNGEANNKADACNAASYSGTVYEGSGSGNVETCMTNHQRNGRWAISINSTEFPAVNGDTSPLFLTGGGVEQFQADGVTPQTVNNKDFQRHIKIDGKSPTTFNVATNRYSNWVEATLNFNNTVALSADAAALKSAFVTGFNDPTVLTSLNNGFNTTALLHAAGDANLDAGIVAPAQSGTPAFPATVMDTHTSPLMYYTHSISGAPNTCQPAMTYSATGLSN
jgi:ABC-type phosphate transport system substrate-binding protein